MIRTGDTPIIDLAIKFINLTTDVFDIVAVVQAENSQEIMQIQRNDESIPDRDEAQACPEPKDEQDNEENPGECAELIVDPGHHILATFRAESL